MKKKPAYRRASDRITVSMAVFVAVVALLWLFLPSLEAVKICASLRSQGVVAHVASGWFTQQCVVTQRSITVEDINGN